MSAEHYRRSYPAITGDPVTQGHANACAEFGHATHIVDGVTSPFCPRCGESTAVEPEPLTLLVERKRLHPHGMEAAAVMRPEMGARLGSMDGTQVEFGVTNALREMFIAVTPKGGERIVETIHLPFLAGEWASRIEAETKR